MLAPLINDWRRIGASLNKGASSCLQEAIFALRKFVGRDIQWMEGADRLPGLLLESIGGFAPIEWLAWRIDASIWASESPFDMCLLLSELPDRLQQMRLLQASSIREQIENQPIVVYSAGSAVAAVLALRHPSEPPIFIAEGRPGNEGVILARHLAKRNFPVRMLTDTGIASRIDEDTCVLLGSDRITRTGFYHKIGTIPLVEVAHARGASVLALGDPLKRNPPDPWPRPQNRSFRRRLPGMQSLQLEGELLEQVMWRESVVHLHIGYNWFHPNIDSEWDSAGRAAMKMLGWPV